MDRDVRLGKNRDARDPTIRREVMQMDVQERCARRLHALPQRLLDVVEFVEPLRPNQIDKEMSSGVADSVSLTEKILALLSHFGIEAPGMVFFRLGGA